MQRVIVVANVATLPSCVVQRRGKESLLAYNFVVCLISWANCIIILVFCFPRSNDIRAIVGTLVGTDQSGNRYYENKEHYFGLLI